MEIKIDSILGLPAHPLFAHGPVVLVPLTAIAAVVCALSRGWRQRLGWLVVGLAFVTLVSVDLAIGSGKHSRSLFARASSLKTTPAPATRCCP